MKESCSLSRTFNIEVSKLFQAWLDSEIHSKMTGGEAKCGTAVGDSFSAWDGYIWGKNIEIIENLKIVQSWRTTEFEEEDEDSLLTLTFIGKGNTTELKLVHTNIPEGQTQYEAGWVNHYFDPMEEYFGN